MRSRTTDNAIPTVTQLQYFLINDKSQLQRLSRAVISTLPSLTRRPECSRTACTHFLRDLIHRYQNLFPRSTLPPFLHVPAPPPWRKTPLQPTTNLKHSAPPMRANQGATHPAANTELWAGGLLADTSCLWDPRHSSCLVSNMAENHSQVSKDKERLDGQSYLCLFLMQSS